MLTDAQKTLIRRIERDLWGMPETGFRETRSTAYLAEVFRTLGYTPVPAGDIPGFVADLDTGCPGPTVAVLGELDALLCPSHPESDPETGAVHACGHHAQGAFLAAVAAAMKNPGALDGLAGHIRFMAVPAEELIEIGYREDLMHEGRIGYMGGKPEFLRRGLFDGVDIAIMVHAAGLPAGRVMALDAGYNGCVAKRAVFRGRAAHAGSAPSGGINALYAATTAITAANALRETFTDAGKVRFHPIITEGGSSVNAIPDRVVVESYVRGVSVDVMRTYNRKINRAFAAAAASIGAELTLHDTCGYFPLTDDPALIDLLAESTRELYGDGAVSVSTGRCSGCTDLGDLSTVMPVVQGVTGGAVGACHGDNFIIADPEPTCIKGAECVVRALQKLLRDGGARARSIKENYRPLYASYEAYAAAASEFTFTLDAVRYNEDGTVTLQYMK